MPGWKVTWNPPDCSNGSNGYPGGWGPEGRPPVAWAHHTPSQALAVPVLPAMSPEGPAPERATDIANSNAAAPPSKPNPGHLFLCGHAVLLGAMTATGDVLSGKAGIEEWSAAFRSESSAAAAAVTPVGGFVLRQHVFAKA